MTLRTKWIDFLYNSATGTRKFRNFFTLIGAFFYTLVMFSFIVIALQVDLLLGINNIFSKPLSIIFALLIFSFALFLIGWSVLNFLRVRGTPVPFNPPPQLVKTGPYAYMRNPMLTGIFSLLFGFGVFFGSLSLLVVFTPLFIFINVWELKVIEEPELMKRLGEDYIEYQKRTPMFFPDFEIIFKRKK